MPDKIPIEQKLPPWALGQTNNESTQMEFECDQKTEAKLHINDMIHLHLYLINRPTSLAKNIVNTQNNNFPLMRMVKTFSKQQIALANRQTDVNNFLGYLLLFRFSC